MSATPPALCPACLADQPAPSSAPCPSCGVAVQGVLWEPWPSGLRVWMLRGLLAAIPAGIAGILLAAVARLVFGVHDRSSSALGWVAAGLGVTAIGLFMVGVTNLILLARRWDYRTPDGRTRGWVQTVLGRVFEAQGTHLHETAVSSPPADRLDSAVLAEPGTSVPRGLTMTVLGMAARGAVVLRVVEERHLRRPPSWALCLGWLRARTAPDVSRMDPSVEIAGTSVDREIRWLERDILERLPPASRIDAPVPDYRQAAAVVHVGAPVSLHDLLTEVIEDVGNADRLRELAASDEAESRGRGATAAEQALAACRQAAPALIDLIDRDAATAAESTS